MSVDIQKLKALAEAATPGPWTVSEEHESASFQGYVAGDADGWIAIFGTANQDADNADYVAAANPAAVLELIADVEANRHEREVVCANYDQLKAENEELRKDAERYQWLRDNASLILDRKIAYQAETGFIKFDTMPARSETETAIDAAMSKEAGHD
jgi:hypothetical protein